MKRSFLVNIFIVAQIVTSCAQDNNQHMNKSFRILTPEETRVIINKGTEQPFTGEYTDMFEPGTYSCKQCGAELYKSDDKFHSGCGWPSFDDEIDGAVKRIPDKDGRRTEIVCANCGGHLGHVFKGEGFTPKNTRHCVNSISLQFVPDSKSAQQATDTAIFAGGCFWGVEYYMQQQKGVLSTDVGYIGGKTKNPTYREVCNHTTGHAEAVRIIYDPTITAYEKLAKIFFEIHDPTQLNRQGPDIGDQYRTEIFYTKSEQKTIAEKLIKELKSKGFNVVTKVTPADSFWIAEDYHQDYYENKNGTPYCHVYTKRF